MDAFSTAFWDNAQSLSDGILDDDFSSSFVRNTMNVHNLYALGPEGSSYPFDLDLFENRIGEAASKDMEMFGDALNLIGKTKLENMTDNMIFLGVCRGKVMDNEDDENMSIFTIDTIKSFITFLDEWTLENNGVPEYPYGPSKLLVDPEIIGKMKDFLRFWINHWGNTRRDHCMKFNYRLLYDKVSAVVNAWN